LHSGVDYLVFNSIKQLAIRTADESRKIDHAPDRRFHAGERGVVFSPPFLVTDIGKFFGVRDMVKWLFAPVVAFLPPLRKLIVCAVLACLLGELRSHGE